MYGIFTYIWVIFRANIGIFSIHGAYGIDFPIVHSYVKSSGSSRQRLYVID